MTPDKVEAALGVASQMRDELMLAYSHEMAICNVECADEYLHRAQALSVLTEALVERERDAARYRWLRERVGVDYSFGGYRAFMTCGNTELDPPATDAAIDAAIKDDSSDAGLIDAELDATTDYYGHALDADIHTDAMKEAP